MGKAAREEFRRTLDAVFYASSEAEARRAFRAFQDHWRAAYPGAVQIIERDLDSLLRFYR